MVKYLAMVEMQTGQTMPPQEVEEEVVRSIHSLGLEMPPVREGWRKETGDRVEICSKPFPGGRPIWYWEVQ